MEINKIMKEHFYKKGSINNSNVNDTDGKNIYKIIESYLNKEIDKDKAKEELQKILKIEE